MFHVFSYDGLLSWVAVESDNVYVARCLLLINYCNIKTITYIGEYKSLEDVYKIIPETFLLDSYGCDIYNKFKNEYCFNFK